MINNKVIYLKSLVKNFKSKQEGLPKEIELRKKQYEYYRNKLLTFDKSNA